MKGTWKRTVVCCGLWFVLAASLVVAEFVPPREGPVAFRRDRLPLDVPAIGALSEQLVTLAGAMDVKTAAERRAVAQMLALALALDPGNSNARRALESRAAGRPPGAAKPELLTRTSARLWQTFSWLETPAAGPDGQALAACLGDVLAIADPEHPQSAKLRAAGEAGAWSEWVAPLADFEKKPKSAGVSPDGEGDEDSRPTTGSEPRIALGDARLRTLLWRRVGDDRNRRWVLAPAALTMSASLRDLDEDRRAPGFSFRIGPPAESESDPFGSINQTIIALLESEHGKLPDRVRIRINAPELENSPGSGRRHPLSAACAVLANAALSGVEPDATILGQIDAAGTYRMSSSGWEQLRALGKGSGGRLVLPSDAATLLPSILAFEKPEFFMEYEVVLARDFKELVGLSAKRCAEPMDSALQMFGEIRSRMGNQDLRTYIGNTFIRQRLAAVQQLSPNHFSSYALLVQSSGNRPTRIVRPVLASELELALEPMLPVVRSSEEGGGQTTGLAAIHDECRKKVDGLERYIEKDDRPLFDQAREVVNAVRTLDRAARGRGESWVVEEQTARARRDLRRLHGGFLAAAGEARGESRPER